MEKPTEKTPWEDAFTQGCQEYKADWDNIQAPNPDFNNQIIRRSRLDRKKKTLNYWIPTLVGAATAAAGVLALLQVFATPPQSPTRNLQNEAAELKPIESPYMPIYTESPSPAELETLTDTKLEPQPSSESATQ